MAGEGGCGRGERCGMGGGMWQERGDVTREGDVPGEGGCERGGGCGKGRGMWQGRGDVNQ